MSKRLKLSDLTKVVAKKAATSASKGVVISKGSETTSGKRALDDGSKGKQVTQSPEPKKARIDTGASGASARPPVTSGAGSSARQVLGEALALRLHRDFAEGALNQKAVAESAEMEMVRAQNRAIELEGALARREGEGKKLAEDVDAEARSSRTRENSNPDLGVDLEDVEMDHELLAKEEAEAEKITAKEEAAECCSVLESHLAVNKSTVPFMSFNTNLGGEESEQSLPSWISDHSRGEVIYRRNEPVYLISTNTKQIPQKMDTSSLNKESNVMSQAELDNLGTTYSFPQGVRLRIPGDGETILCLYSLSPLPDSGWYYFKERPEKNLLQGSPSNVKGVEDEVLFCLGGQVWELAPGTAASESSLRVPRSWGAPGKSCNKLPTLSAVDAKRMEAIFGKIEPGGYFEVSKVLSSRTFKKHFAVDCSAVSTNGGDNTTSGDEGELGTCEDSVEYLGVIRRGKGSVYESPYLGRPAPVRIQGRIPFRIPSYPPSSDLMLCRPEVKPWPRRQKKATRAGLLEGQETVPPPPPKRFKSNRGAINARGRAAEVGTSSPAGDRGSESMSDASVARRLLTEVIPAAEQEEVDQLSENDLVAKSFHALGQVVVFASSLALRSQEHLHDIDFHMARADSTELELATVAELTSKLAKAKELAIEDFKASEEFKAAVTDSVATYFGDGFEFCKRQLLHQFPNLGADVASMAMDPSFAEEEEAVKEGGDHVAGVAPDV
ncbi:hypothetical protein Acr_18g0011660 [Actinidia rufa]|uniref:Uncharacterized protein n=1 Tax=Actinidia rufa TaxID=165716 RepID=A0A7J0G867_9ERIC|nr:hypothetical protein Acr_18g0011660 [Actinidia rufa]